MAAEYMHIGIPVLNRKEGMVYNCLLYTSDAADEL